jgi:DNA-binding IclR family transcriptional regulator
VKVLEAVQACPGETMTVIAARVGEKPRALHRPMMRLKEAGRVRSAGARNFTRYFPMTGKPA